eukprot:scaffold1482_cov120-Cylindrotheca_fusiformis.AAC.20
MNQGWYNPQCKAEEEKKVEEKSALEEQQEPRAADEEPAKEGEPAKEEVVGEGDDDDNEKKQANIKDDQKPSLEKAWAYFEHFALNRYVVNESKNWKKAEPGEDELPTKLYNPFTMPHNQLGDFGLGIGLYFSTLRLIFLLVFVSGLLSIANITFFASEDYQPISNREAIMPTLVRGSAICTDTSWVACPTCICANNDRLTAQEMRREDLLPTKRCQRVDGQVFVLKNECGDIPLYVGMINYATVILFFLVTTVYMGGFLERQEIKFDEDEQTAQDYSVQVENPRKSSNLVVGCSMVSTTWCSRHGVLQRAVQRNRPNGTISSRRTLVPMSLCVLVPWKMICL